MKPRHLVRAHVLAFGVCVASAVVGCAASALEDNEGVDQTGQAICQDPPCIPDDDPPPPPPPPPQRPDLVVVQTVPRYCTSHQTITVTVKNQGNASVGPTTHGTITFSTYSGQVPITFDVPPLGVGASTVVGSFPIPAGCFSADCFFSIAVDTWSQVTESKEGNNQAYGSCLG